MTEAQAYIRQMKVVALGSGACRALDRMLDRWPGPPCTVAVDTDERSLTTARTAARLSLGPQLTKGYGSGGDPRVGKLAAEESTSEWRSICIDADWMVLVTALGGGTATGAAPVLTRVAASGGTKVLAIALMPFEFEDADRIKRAQRGLTDLHAACDAVIAVPNGPLLKAAGADAPATEAFAAADGVVGGMLAALCRMLMGRGLLTLDLPSLNRLLKGRMAPASFGFGQGVGDDRTAVALADLLVCPTYPEEQRPPSAAAVWAAVLAGPSVAFQDIETALTDLRATLAADADFFPGVYIDETLDDRVDLVAVTVGPARKREEPDLLQLDVSASLSQGAARRSFPSEEQLKLESPQKGRFKDVDPTLVDGEDLDVPTYMRRHIHFEKAR